MPLKKGKNDGFAALQKEAEEDGIGLEKTAEGYVATFELEDGELEWGPGEDAQAVLDDMRALVAMEEKPELFSYEEDGTGGARVTVEGIKGHFDSDTFAGAFAAAQEAVQKAQAATDAPKSRKRSAASAAAPEPGVEGEVLDPIRPNGDGKPVGDGATLQTMSAAFAKAAEVFLDLSKALSRDEALVPFMTAAQNFSEESVPAGKSRVRRERGK